MLKDKQMSTVVYYYLETGKSRNFLGIQISKKSFLPHHYIITFIKCYSMSERKNPLFTQSPYYVFSEVLMSK